MLQAASAAEPPPRSRCAPSRPPPTPGGPASSRLRSSLPIVASQAASDRLGDLALRLSQHRTGEVPSERRTAEPREELAGAGVGNWIPSRTVESPQLVPAQDLRDP